MEGPKVGPAVPAPAADEKQPRESDNSEEYDSAEGDSSYSEEAEEEDERVRPRSRASEECSEGEVVEGGIQERQSGDGQESVPNKKVDHDEDKKNPQYIPKRGTFYEHDDRTLDEPEEKETVEADKTDKDGKKKVWADKKERWTHDRFNDSEQAPKSKSELVAIYGYDIRNEDGPPRARRRRRYGRGPNKYTRNWEDEDAYNKAPPAPRARRNAATQPRDGPGEDFPPLAGETNDVRDDRGGGGPDEWSNKRNSVDRSEATAAPGDRPAAPSVRDNRQAGPQRQNSTGGSPGGQTAARPAVVRAAAAAAKPRREIKDSDYRGFTARVHQIRNQRGDQQRVLPPTDKKDDFVQSQNFTNTAKSAQQQLQQQVERDMSKLNVRDGVYRGGPPPPQPPRGGGHLHHQQQQGGGRQGSVPPRLQQAEQKGPKRYSSMRQRSLPETATPPATAGAAAAFPHSFYPTDYDSTAPPPPSQAPIMAGGALPLAAQPAPPPPPVLAPAQFAPPPQFAQPPPAAFLPAPAGPPPQFMAAPQVVNFPQQLVAAGVPAFQGFQPPFNPVTQPTELYQPQGGITYYSTDQQLMQRAAPQKRPKAAIPIVAPDEASRGDGSGEGAAGAVEVGGEQ